MSGISDSGWTAGRWWRVVLDDGTLWCETSVEREAVEALSRAPRRGELQRQFVRTESVWRVPE